MKTWKSVSGLRMAQMVLSLAVVLVCAARAYGGYATLPYAENFETGLLNTNYWTLQGTWKLTTENAHGGTNSLTDSPQGVYPVNVDTYATLGVDLRHASRPILSFWQSYMLEPNRDYAFLEVSIDQGTNWTRYCPVSGFGGTNWYSQRLDLTPYAGSQLLIRFRLKSDGANSYDGWYIDDVEVKENTALASFPLNHNMDSASSATNWLGCGWNLVSGGANTSDGQSWRCQVGNDSYNPAGPFSAVMTLAGTFDLNPTIHPCLSFWWRAGGQADNTLQAQVSRDGGMTWNTVWSWNSYWWNSFGWSRAQADLSAFLSDSEVAIRFVASHADRNYQMDFQIDNLVVDELPPELTVTVGPGTEPRHSALLNWSVSTAPAFAYYAIYRSTSSGVDSGDLLLTTISNRATHTYEDTTLDVCGQNYYYRVMVWNTNELRNFGSADVVYRTSWGQRVESFPFVDGLEGTDAKWALDRPWAISTEMARTGTHSLSDSPAGNYANNADVSATLRVFVQGMNRPILSYWQRYSLELNRDFAFLEVSGDDGANWTRWAVLTGYSGTNWLQQRFDLTPFSGQEVLIRFRVKSNGSVQDDGWHLDDVEIKDSGILAGFPFVDNMDSDGSVTNWLLSGSWKQVGGSANTNAGQSYQCAFGDDAGGGGLAYNVMTLAGTMDFSTAVNPMLSFAWRAGAQANNTLSAQISRDGGKNWDTVNSWNSYWWTSSGWARVQKNLSAYVGYSNVVLRFLTWHENRNYQEDFQIDEVSVDETPSQPLEIAAYVNPGPDPRHSASLTWSNSTTRDFACYSVYRSTSPNVSVGSYLVTAISNRATLSFTDTGLDVCGQSYYYRVIVWDTHSLHSTGSDLLYRTKWGQSITNLPFADGLEGTDASWALDRPWAVTTERAHAGTHCLSDSPGGNYGNNVDASAILSVYLKGLKRPYLSFWHIYSLELNRDYGFVEISTDDGASWTRNAVITGYSGTNWQNQRMDLTPYSGQQVLIRFRLKSNGSTLDDGWYLDDVEIKDNTAVAGYPVYEYMNGDNTVTNWLASGMWAHVGGSSQTNAGQSWQCKFGDDAYNPGGGAYSVLTMAGTIDFTKAVNPLLSYWWRAGGQANNTIYAQISRDGGKNWDTVSSWNSYWWTSATWTRAQVNLASYLGYSNAALRFLTWQDNRNYAQDFQVDEITLDEVPADVTLAVAPGTDPRHGARLSWSASTSSAFSYYSIYRSTSTGVDPGDFLVTTISNKSTVAFEDTGLGVCGQTYYYRVLVWNTNGLHNWGAGDVAYRTSWGATVTNFPFSDSLEAGDGYWALDQPWAVTTEAGYGGIHCLSDSPSGNYANNADTSASLRVNLLGINRPCLTFRHLYSFEVNRDFGLLEISTDDGANWTRWAVYTGYNGTNWENSRFDLTPFSGQVALIRWRIRSNSGTQDNGWYVDLVEIKDNGAVTAYPFYDNMDSAGSTTNWLASGAWKQVGGSVNTNAGQSWRCSFGDDAGGPGGAAYNVLTMTGTMNLSAAVNPYLSFWWRAGGQANNTLYAQASRDGGKNFSTLYSWNSYWWNPAAWNRTQVSLAGYLGVSNVVLRFLTWHENRNYAEDFQVDEVLVDEARAELAVTVLPGDDPRHNALLGWQQAKGQNFSFYGIYRSTKPGVTTNDTLVTVITNRTTLSFQDTNLPVCGQSNYYRVLAFYADGFQTTGTNDAVYRTAWGSQVVSLPFADSLESGSTTNWALDWPWGLATNAAHEGVRSLASSPGALYGNNLDRSATLRLDLRGATRPYLSFWQRYSMEDNRDYGFVEISSNDGSTWTAWSAITGYADWENQRVDLTPYAGTQALIRFRLKTDAQNQDEGWFIDEVLVAENPAVTAYPFSDNVDLSSSRSNWLAATWTTVGGSAQDQPGLSWRCAVGDGFLPGSNYYSGPLFASLTLMGTLDLSRATKPKLWFWFRAGQQPYHTLSAQVSSDGGKNWDTVWTRNTLDSGATAWEQVQADLIAYARVSQLALRFLAYNPGNTSLKLDFQVDEVVVGEAACPTIVTPSPLPDGVVSGTYSLSLQAANGATPYTWGLASNSLPPGMVLSTNGVIGGAPTTAGAYEFWVSVTDSNRCSGLKRLNLTVQSIVPPSATHSTQPFVSPGTNVVFCQVVNHVTNQLLSLVWSPSLPSGWSVIGVTGDGAPEVGPDGKILFASYALTNSVLSFNYRVRIPAGQTAGAVLGGSITYLYWGMNLDGTVPASPDILMVSPRTYHSADCSQNWKIETLEANRVLAYWRAQSYQLNPWTCDGYAPGIGDKVGAFHSADYRATYWQIDGTEVNRVLAYWRAGCYHKDPTGLDGYAAGCSGKSSRDGKGEPTFTQSANLVYAPGTTVKVTNTVVYTGSLLSLLWRPSLPAGWDIVSVEGTGSPELVAGDIVWTAESLPSSPLTMVYSVAIPSDASGPKSISSGVEYQAPGAVNPATSTAAPEPLTLNTGVVQELRFTAIEPLPDGRIRLQLRSSATGAVRVLYSPQVPATSWSLLTNWTTLTGTVQFYDTGASNKTARFYRAVSP